MSDVSKNVKGRPGGDLTKPSFSSSHPSAPPDRLVSINGARTPSPAPQRDGGNPAFTDNGGRRK